MIAGLRSIDELFGAIMYENPQGEDIVNYIKLYKRKFYEVQITDMLNKFNDPIFGDVFKPSYSITSYKSTYLGIFDLMMDHFTLRCLLRREYNFDLLPYLRRFDITIWNHHLYKDFIEKYHKLDLEYRVTHILIHSFDTFDSSNKRKNKVKICEEEKDLLLTGFLDYMNTLMTIDDISDKLFEGKKKEKIKQVFVHMRKTLIKELGKMIEEGERNERE